jgi:predicted MFS family arabinose efflux permease
MVRRVGTAYREAFSGLPRDVWAFAGVTLVYRSGTMVLPFLALYLTTARGMSPTQAGAMLALYGIGALAGSALGGWLSDVVGPLRVCRLSLLLAGVTLLVLRGLESPRAIAAALLALSVASEAFRPASSSAVAALTNAGSRVRAAALRRLAINLGMTLAPSVGGFLALRDYGWLFIVDAAACFGAAAFLWIVLPARIVAPDVLEAPHSRESQSPWMDRGFLFFLLLTALFATVFFQLLSTFPLTLRDSYALGEDRIGLAIGTNAFLIVLFEMVLLHALRRRAPLKVIRLGALLSALALALLPWGSSFSYVILVMLVLTLGEMFFMPVAEGFVANRAGESNRGRYMGMYSLAYSIAFAVSPGLGTWVYATAGATVLWSACGVAGILLWLGFTRLSTREGARLATCVSGSS